MQSLFLFARNLAHLSQVGCLEKRRITAVIPRIGRVNKHIANFPSKLPVRNGRDHLHKTDVFVTSGDLGSVGPQPHVLGPTTGRPFGHVALTRRHFGHGVHKVSHIRVDIQVRHWFVRRGRKPHFEPAIVRQLDCVSYARNQRVREDQPW